MAEMEDVPTSRTYVHSRCRGATIVSGDDFESLANPFRFSSGTMCATCNKIVPIKQVAWADTGESIADYRRRIRSETPVSHKVVAWLIGPVLLGLIGGAIGYAIKPGDTKALVIGAITGALTYLGVFVPLVTRLLFGVDYRIYE